MKKILAILLVFVAIVSLSSCYDRSVLDDKGLNYYMPMAENVQCVHNNADVTLSWKIPANIPEEFKRPISVQIQVVENDIYRDKVTLTNEETSYSFTIDPENRYRYIVKLVGTFLDEYQEKGRTNSVTSEGVVVKVE